MSGSTAELRILITSKDSASQAIKGLGQNLGGLGVAGKVATAALAGIAVAGGALAGIIGKSVGAAMDFEGAMSAVGAVAGASGSELAGLSQTALALGQDVTLAGISASEAAAAMEQLASGGISVADIMGGAARGALLLASAGGIDVARAAEIGAAALNNFGLAGSDMAHVADLFAAAANSSAVTVTDLGESLKYIGPIAASMGLSIEDVTATLAALGDQGIKGSAAGTALRSMLVSLASPSKQAASIIKDLGLEMFDANGKMKSLGDISEQLKTKMAGLTDQQRAHALSTIFGSEALSAATVLFGTGAEGIAKYLAQVNVAGSAAANGAKRNDNLKGSIEQLKSSWETASIVLGTAFIPLVRQMVDLLAGAVNAAIPLIAAFGPRFVAAIQSGIGQAVAVVQSFATAIMAAFNALRTGDFSNLFGPIITAISTAFGADTAGRVTLFVSNLVTGLNLARDAVLTAKQAFAGDWVNSAAIAGPVALVGQLFLTLGNAVRTVQGWIAQIPTPVLAAAAGFLALGPALTIVGAILPTLVGAFTGLGPIIGILTSSIPLLGTVIGALGGPLTLAIVAVAALAAAWATDFMGIQTATMPIITAIGAMITGTLLPALEQIGTFFTGTVLPQLQAGVAFVAPLFAQVGAAIQTAFATIVPALQQFGAAFGQLLSAVAPVVQQIAGLIMSSLGPAITALAGWAATVIPQFAAAWANVLSIISPIIAAIAAFITENMGTIQAVVGAVWGIITGIIEAAFTTITTIVSAGLQLISGDWEGAWATIQAGAASVWQSILQIITSAWSGISALLTAGLTGLQNLWGTVWPALQTIAQNAWEGIKTTISNAIDGVKATITTGLNSAKEAAQTALDNMATAASTAMESLKTAISNGIESAKSTVTNGVAGFPAAVLAIGGAMFSAGASIIGQLTAGIASAIGAAISKVQEGLQQIANLLPHSEPKDPQSPLRGLTQAGRTIFEMFGEGISQGAPAAVKAAAEAASSVAKAVTDGLSALSALSSFTGGPSDFQVSGFLDSLADFMEKFTTRFADWEEDVLKGASQFAQAASSAVGIIKGGVEGLQLLDTFVAPLEASVGYFLASLADFMEKFAGVAGGFEADVLAVASTFAEGVSKAVGVLSSGVSGLMALADFKAPLEATVDAFLGSLADFMERFSTVAGGFEADVLAVSSAFADGVGKAVGVLGAGVAGLMSLADFVAPTEAAVSAFLASLADFMERFATATGAFEADVLTQAAKFAEGAGKVVAIIGGAVGGFEKLLTFVAPSQEVIDQFVYAVYATVRKIADMAGNMSAEGIEAAGAFGTAANTVLGALKTGLDVFSGMAKLVVPSAEAIDQFGIAVAYTVRRLGAFADEIGKGGLEQATKFGTSVQAIFGSLKSSMDILTNLKKFKDVAEEAFSSLLAGLQGAIEQAQAMVSQSKNLVLESEEFLANMTKAAANFAKGQSLGGVSGEEIGKSLGQGVSDGAKTALDSHSPSQVMAAIGRDVVAGLVAGMDDAQQDAAAKAASVAKAVAEAISAGVSALTALGGFVAPGAGALAAFGTTLRASIRDLATLAGEVGQELVALAGTFAESAGKSVGIFSSAVAGFTSLVGFVSPATAAIYAFGKSLRLALNDLAVLAEQITTETSDLAARFGEGAAKAIAVYGTGVDAFTKLRDYTGIPAAAIYAFGKDLRLAINDLAIIAEQVTLDSAVLAGRFAEGAGKALAIIGTGVDGLTKLVGFVAPANAAIYAFGKAMRAFIEDFAIVAEQVGVDTAVLAGKFADGAGKAVSIVGAAISGFAGLATFIVPARATVDGLIATVKYAVQRFGQMATEMSTEGLTATKLFGEATTAVLSGVKLAIDTFIALDKAEVPKTGDLSDLVVAVQGVTRNMAKAAAELGTDAIADATAFGTAAQGIFTALKSGLDLFIEIDKPGNWPQTDWLQPLIELMQGVLLRGGKLLTQSQELKAIADQFAANLTMAGAAFGSALGLGEWALTGNIGGGGAGLMGGGGTIINNNTYVTGNTLLSKDTATQQMVSGIVTTQQSRTIGYSTSG